MNKKNLKIIYENYVKNQNKYISYIKESIVSFEKPNSEWINNYSYDENFEIFIEDVFDRGYVYIGDQVVSVFMIKSFQKNDSINKNKKHNKFKEAKNIEKESLNSKNEDQLNVCSY